MKNSIASFDFAQQVAAGMIILIPIITVYISITLNFLANLKKKKIKKLNILFISRFINKTSCC